MPTKPTKKRSTRQPSFLERTAGQFQEELLRKTAHRLNGAPAAPVAPAHLPRATNAYAAVRDRQRLVQMRGQNDSIYRGAIGHSGQTQYYHQRPVRHVTAFGIRPRFTYGTNYLYSPAVNYAYSPYGAVQHVVHIRKASKSSSHKKKRSTSSKRKVSRRSSSSSRRRSYSRRR